MTSISSAREERSAGLAELFSAASQGLGRALSAVRNHLGMEVAFISEFVGDVRHFRHVDTVLPSSGIEAGASMPIASGYCRDVVDGRLPELIPDTALVPAARAKPETRALPIGSHIAVPLRLSSGRIYGTFCCFSRRPDPTLNERDLSMLRAFADLIGFQIETEFNLTRIYAEKAERIQAVLAAGQPTMVYQPVFRLADGRMDGAEALARFAAEPARPPDRWFAEAGEVGMQVDLERVAIRHALEGFGPLWAELGHLGVNSSPRTILEGDLLRVAAGYPLDRIVLEITEHERVSDYGALRLALAPLRQRGVKVAVDDAGSGYASLSHIININPDFIKLDVSFTRGIDTDRQKRALASALTFFGRETGCRLVAEGVETASELATLKDLGAYAAQGYHLGRPGPVDGLLRAARGPGSAGSGAQARRSARLHVGRTSRIRGGCS